MLCGVTATLGSNPSATATAARPRWGRAALSCPSGVCPGRALCARVVCVRGVLCHARRLFCLKYRSGSSAMSHVIPPRLLQTLNRGRWNCNVCGLSRKMTELNYVRNLAGGFLDDACRRVSTHAGASRRVSAPQLAAWPSGPSGAACASSWLDGRCVLPDLSPFYGTASASDNPGPLVPQWGYVPALNTVTAWSQFRTT